MSGVGLPELLITTLFAAGCSYYFGCRLATAAREWEAKRHAVKTVEHFCDNLLRDSIAYWSQPVDAGNYDEMRAYAAKMGAILLELSGFLYDHFPKNAKVSAAFKEVSDVVTGDEFAVSERSSDMVKVQRASSVLVKLRFAVQSEPKGSRGK